jgi:hypothetical protein
MKWQLHLKCCKNLIQYEGIFDPSSYVSFWVTNNKEQVDKWMPYFAQNTLEDIPTILHALTWKNCFSSSVIEDDVDPIYNQNTLIESFDDDLFLCIFVFDFLQEEEITILIGSCHLELNVKNGIMSTEDHIMHLLPQGTIEFALLPPDQSLINESPEHDTEQG